MVSQGKVVITGGSGKVGAHVVKAFVEQGYEVLNIDRVASRDASVQTLNIDVRDRAALEPVLRGATAVCHLAEIPNVLGNIPPDELFVHNISAGASVIKACADAKVPRVIYSSTVQVFGYWGPDAIGPSQFPIDESTPVQPQNIYALAKYANEQFAIMLARKLSMSLAVFRFPWVITPEVASQLASSQRERTGRFFDGFGTYIHVSDLARAYVQAVQRPRPGAELYCLAADDIDSAYPLAQRLVHHPELPPLPAHWGDFQSLLLHHKASAHFDFAPRWSFQSNRPG